MPEISQAWLALIGAILGGSGLKLLEHYLSRPRIKDDTAMAFRNELREEMKRLKEDVRSAVRERDNARDDEEGWRDKYYALIEQAAHDRMERDAALAKIQEAADRALYSEHTLQEKKNIQVARDQAAEKLREAEDGR